MLLFTADSALTQEALRFLFALTFFWVGGWNYRLGNRLLETVLALRDVETPRQTERFYRWVALTPREREVCELVLGGLSPREIASRMDISFNTAKNHIASVFLKSMVSTRAELVHRIRVSREVRDIVDWDELRSDQNGSIELP